MIAGGETYAETAAEKLRDRAAAAADEALGSELERLRALAMVNPEIREQEIEELEREQGELEDYLRAARLRLDALRLIWRGPCIEGRPCLHP